MRQTVLTIIGVAITSSALAQASERGEFAIVEAKSGYNE
jgi:hypothetical protein